MLIIKDCLPPLRDEDNCYLQYITDAGIIAYKSANMKTLGYAKNGITKPKIVLLDNQKAYCKDSRQVDDSDDTELLINYLGLSMGIKMAKVYRHISLDYIADSLISMDVATNNSIFIPMSDLRNQIKDNVKSGKQTYELWMNQYSKIISQRAYSNIEESFESIAYDDEQIRTIINVGIEIIRKVCGTDSNHIIFDYLKMIYLDALIGNADRTMNNYGVLFNQSTNYYEFAPLFDNATLEKPYSCENYCLINGVFCERIKTLSILIDTYKLELKPSETLLSSIAELEKNFKQNNRILKRIMLKEELK